MTFSSRWCWRPCTSTVRECWWCERGTPRRWRGAPRTPHSASKRRSSLQSLPTRSVGFYYLDIGRNYVLPIFVLRRLCYTLFQFIIFIHIIKLSIFGLIQLKGRIYSWYDLITPSKFLECVVRFLEAAANLHLWFFFTKPGAPNLLVQLYSEWSHRYWP